MVELIDVNKMGSLGPKLRALGPKLRALGPKWGPLGSRPVQWYSLLKIFKFVELFDVNKTGALEPKLFLSESSHSDLIEPPKEVFFHQHDPWGPL